LEQLGNVEVTTASKEPEQVWRTPAAVYVLTQEDIRRSGATSVPEVLRLVPGVEVARIDANQWAIGIRDFGSGFSKSVLVLIDGRSVYTPLYAGVYWDVQNVLLDDVERIEVIRGPGGTIWGANAQNGVINIITENSKDSQGGFFSLGGGNRDQAVARFRYGGSLGDNLKYRVYGMAFGDGPEFHTNGNNFDAWQIGQGGFRLDWDNQRRDKMSVEGEFYKGAVGTLANITYYSPLCAVNEPLVQQVSGGHVLARWQYRLGKGSDIQVQGYYDRTSLLSERYGEIRNTFNLDFVHHIAIFPRQDVIWGLGARWSPSKFIQQLDTLNFLPQRESDDIYSAFAQDQIALVGNKLWATLGSKFEHNIYTGWEIMPSARLLWTPSPRQTFWVSTTRSVRTPSRLDEDIDFAALVSTTRLPILLQVAGNSKFVSETLPGYEAGYRKLVTPRFYVDLSLFHNDYDNLTSYGAATLSYVNSPPPINLLLTVPYANGIRGTTNGGEIAPAWKATRWLDFKASYSYMNLNLRDKPGSTDASTVLADEGSSPRHQGVVQALLSLPGGSEIDPTYRYVSALPALAINAYGTMDVRVGWQFARNIELSLVGQNLLQPHRAEFNGDPGPLVAIKRSA
jgi:iron complex outermembrane receptor protein